MFVHILSTQQGPPTERTAELFQRFKDVPGLEQAFSLQSEDDPNEGYVVAIWESRESADRYLEEHPLRRSVDEAMPGVTRKLFRVLDAK